MTDSQTGSERRAAVYRRPVPVDDSTAPCPTCGRILDTPFCPHCGERRPADRSYSLFDFSKENFFEHIASVDGRAVRTLTALLRRPGELTVQYMRGTRKPYVAPLQTFLILNVLFFIWSGAQRIPMYDPPLAQQLTMNTAYREMANRLVATRLAATHQDRASFELAFNTIGSAQSRSLMLVMVPVFAVVVGLLAFSRRKRRYAVQHVVFALHFYAFSFVVIPLSFLMVRLLLGGLRTGHLMRPGEAAASQFFSVTLYVVFALYLAAAFRRAYDTGPRRAAISAIVATFASFMIFVAYRGLLFFVTFYSM
jgi:hypothetical protein